MSNLEQEVKRLTAIVQAPSTPGVKEEIATLRASFSRALCSVQDLRASAQETRDVRELVEKALRQENLALKEKLKETRQELDRAKSELNGNRLLPFVRRFIHGRGKVVEVVAPETPPSATLANQMRHYYM